MKALITGSCGLIGSACTQLLCEQGWSVIGIDNDMRKQFFGADGSTHWMAEYLCESLPGYRHFPLDIRNRERVREIFKTERPDTALRSGREP